MKTNAFSRLRSIVLAAAIAFAVLGHSAAVLAATYYFNGLTDTWTGNNTFTSVESGSVTLQAGDRVETYNLYGNASGPRRIRWSVSDITIAPRVGFPQFIADGGINAVALTGASWTSRGGGKWSIPVAAFTTANGGIQCVTSGYISNQGGFWNGSNGGYLRRVADLATCDATNMSWWFDTGASPPVLYVRHDLITTAEAAANEFDVVRGTATIGEWSVVECNGANARIDGLVIWRASPRGSAAYGIVSSGLGTLIINCIVHDAGYHNIGLNTGGGNLTSGTVRGCTVYGLGYFGSSTSYVAYSDNLVSGVLFDRCVAYMHGLYMPDGSHLAPDNGTSYSGSMDGFYTHGNGTVSAVQDYEVRDCAVFTDISMMSPNGGPRPIYARPYAVGQTIAVKGDPMDWRSYPARHVRCTAQGFGVWAFAPGAGTGTAIAFSQCTFRSGEHTAGAGWADLNVGSSKGGIIGLGTSANNATILWSGCLITMTQMTASGTGFGVIGTGDGSPVNNTLIFLRCTVLHTGNLSGRTGGEWLFTHRHDIEPTTARVIARESIFAFTDVRSGAATYTGTASTGLFRDAFSKMTTARAPIIYDFARNAYHIGTTSTVWASFTPTSNYNTVAKLSDTDPSDRGIDPMGIYGVSPAFVDGGTQATRGVPAQAFMDAAGVVLKNTPPGPLAAILGINRRRGECIGAVQWGKVPLTDQIGVRILGN